MDRLHFALLGIFMHYDPSRIKYIQEDSGIPFEPTF